MPNDLSRDEAAFLKDFASAGAAGRLWACQGYRVLVAVGKVGVPIAGAVGAIAALWHSLFGGAR